MSDRENMLRSLLDKVRAKRPVERSTQAVDFIERVKAASGSDLPPPLPSPVPPATAPSAPPSLRTASVAPGLSTPGPAPSESSASVRPTNMLPSAPNAPIQETPITRPSPVPGLDSPTRYSSRPPGTERPLSGPSWSRRSSSTQPTRSPRPESIHPQSVAPAGRPVVSSTEPPEFPRPKTFGELLELTLSLRPD